MSHGQGQGGKKAPLPPKKKKTDPPPPPMRGKKNTPPLPTQTQSVSHSGKERGPPSLVERGGKSHPPGRAPLLTEKKKRV